MSYLIYSDYKKLIQQDNLQQVINEDTTILSWAQSAAITEVVSYLVQKYRTDLEFTDTGAYNPAKVYYAGDRVYLDAFEYSLKTYLRGELTQWQGQIYVSRTAIIIPEAFTLSKWIYLGDLYDIFYVGYPFPIFNYQKYYNVGDKVYWQGKVYTALRSSTVIGHDVQLQSAYISECSNPFPSAGFSSFWGEGVIYTVAPGTLYSNPVNNFTPQYVETEQLQYTSLTGNETQFVFPELIGNKIIQVEKEIKPLFTAAYTINYQDGTFALLGSKLALGESLYILYSTLVNLDPTVINTQWVKGDNRNAMMVNMLIDVILYHTHARISPRNIPDLRIKRYDDVIAWLKNVAKGENITADLPRIQPKSGARIRFGGRTKNENSY